MSGITAETHVSPVPSQGRRYVEGDAESIAIGAVPLKTFLQDTPLRWVLALDTQLRTLDWTLFDSGKRGGRPPLHPRILAGLVVYGMLRGQWSLRQLETLAATDLGAWWICGGLRPDHSTVGDFVALHAERLAREVFDHITQTLARSAKIAPSLAALDGTVIEAAGSRFQILRQEAANANREEAREVVSSLQQQAPSTEPPSSLEVSQHVAEVKQAQRRLAQCEAVVAAVQERAEVRSARGDHPDQACVCATDWESVVQPRKDKVARPGWKPSVIVHPSGLVLGQVLDPSCERVVVPSLLAQYEAALGAPPETTLVDGGYVCESVLNVFVARELDVLCPVNDSPVSSEEEAPKKYSKRLFVYQPESDSYRCPTGRSLVHQSWSRESSGQRADRYRGRECGDCPQRAFCTTSPHGRMVKRYAVDEYKEALGLIMQHPHAKALYRRRMAIVEPVFSALRERQGLVRFHRRGRKGAAAEFALHCIAYNLRKAQRIAARRVRRTLRERTSKAQPRGRFAMVAAWSRAA